MDAFFGGVPLCSGGTYGHALAEVEGCVIAVGGGARLEEPGLCIGQPGYRIISTRSERCCGFAVNLLEGSHSSWQVYHGAQRAPRYRQPKTNPLLLLYWFRMCRMWKRSATTQSVVSEVVRVLCRNNEEAGVVVWMRRKIMVSIQLHFDRTLPSSRHSRSGLKPNTQSRQASSAVKRPL